MASTPRILALDLSLTSTGHCVGPGAQAVGTIPTGKLRGAERLSHITTAVQGLVKTGTDLVVIESPPYHVDPRRSRSTLSLARLRGCIDLLLFRLGVPSVDVNPMHLKLWATGKSKVGKDAIIADAIRRFGFQGNTNDEADAFMLWTMAATHYGSMTPVKLPQTHLAALAKVEWPTLDGGPA